VSVGESRARPPVPGPIGRLGERFYRAAIDRRNAAFDLGQGVVRLSVPVISVGNLSVGGTGKTPMVMRAVEWLLDAGRRPAIAMRGYRARPGEPSDEEAEYRDRFTDVAIVAQPDRAAGLAPLIEEGEVDSVVLDDGFQHRQLDRDLDIVLLDATRPFDQDRCLPAGWLREPAESLARAGAVVLTRIDQANEATVERLRRAVEAATGHPPTAECAHGWESVRVGTEDRPVEVLCGRSVVVACAIGNPESFVRACEGAGAIVSGTLVRRDHHAWNARDLRELRRLAGLDAVVLTTAKDFVKLRGLDLGDLSPRVAVPRLAIRFTSGEDALRDAVMQAVAAAPGVH